MNKKMLELMERRRRLLSRIAAQREQMIEIGSHLQTPLLLADRGAAVARFLSIHPLLIAGFAVFFVIRRRSLAGLVWGMLRVWKVYRGFSLLSAKLLS